MTALTVENPRAVFAGRAARLALEAAANPFAGSALSIAADGYVHELVAGEPFAGFCKITVQSKDAAAADGAREVDATTGRFYALLTISGAAQDDVAHGRKVYASDDNTFTFTPTGNSLIGKLIGLDSSGVGLVLCMTNGEQDTGFAGGGVVVKAATGNLTIPTSDLDKLIVLPSTGAQAVTLPAAADCGGRTLTFKKTTADAVAATLTRAGSDTIDGATTVATIDAANDTITLLSDGVDRWHIIAQKIA